MNHQQWQPPLSQHGLDLNSIRNTNIYSCVHQNDLSYSYHISFDGGFKLGKASWCFIVTNTSGENIFADSDAYDEAQNAEESELRAFFQALLCLSRKF